MHQYLCVVEQVLCFLGSLPSQDGIGEGVVLVTAKFAAHASDHVKAEHLQGNVGAVCLVIIL
jgi:hypothetical protein